jgi:hypothetical protein
MRMVLPCHWGEGGLRDFAGRVRFRRRFGYPGQIDDWERVWITIAAVSDRAAVRLNGADLGECVGDGCFEFEATRLLRQRNELVVDVEGSAEHGGLWGETALEVRCTAFLRGVRVWVEGGAWHAAGQVVGEAVRPLDLYVLINNATVAYRTVAPAPAGSPFHIIADNPARALAVEGSPEQATTSLAQVDLVNGAVVWYTTVQELPNPPIDR